MAKHPMGHADSRPRIYISQTMDGRFAWKWGLSGDLRGGGQRTVGEAVDAALHNSAGNPAVIFWEGRTHG